MRTSSLVPISPQRGSFEWPNRSHRRLRRRPLQRRVKEKSVGRKEAKEVQRNAVDPLVSINDPIKVGEFLLINIGFFPQCSGAKERVIC